MLKQTKGWEGAGKLWLTLEEAQVAELMEIFKTEPNLAWTDLGISERLLANADKIVAILSEKQVGRPRKAKKAPEPKEKAV